MDAIRPLNISVISSFFVFCECIDRFVTGLVGSPEDRFSHVATYLIYIVFTTKDSCIMSHILLLETLFPIQTVCHEAEMKTVIKMNRILAVGNFFVPYDAYIHNEQSQKSQKLIRAQLFKINDVIS